MAEDAKRSSSKAKNASSTTATENGNDKNVVDDSRIDDAVFETAKNTRVSHKLQRFPTDNVARVRSKTKDQGTSGILRVDSTSRSPRYTVGVPFLSPIQVEPSSPQPSVDRLSVTFAITENRSCDNSCDTSVDQRSRDCSHDDRLTSSNSCFEMQRIPAVTDVEDAGDEDDYSASACAIMQRRASSRCQSRRKRRSSSPFSPDAESALRRRSSVFTTSSADTAISIDDGGTQEQIFENLKLHKEVLGGVKQQPWPLRRKIRLVQQAKSYVRRHEGALQERLAQSHSTRDVIARASIVINKKWQYCRRELVNLQTWLVPWELRIKEIESHFGSAVASYFIFLRWLFWINLVISGTLAAFVTIPEVLTGKPELAGERKELLPEEKAKSKHLLTIWEFEGALKNSPFFYGWYTNQDFESGYRLPLAYFIANLIVYTYSFVAILRKMAENSRMSKLSEKDDECTFSWKLFTGWDFMIGNPETAHNRIASIVLGFKETLLEEAEKEKDERNWKITAVRIFVNLFVISLLALSAYAVVEVVARSSEAESDQTNWWRKNEITVVMSLISFIFPMVFEILGILENYHPRKQLRIQLARIMVLNLLNLYSLIFALFDKIGDMDVTLQNLKPKTEETTVFECKYEVIPCGNDLPSLVATVSSLSLVLLSNVSSMNVGRIVTSQTDLKNLPEMWEMETVPYSATESYASLSDNAPVEFDEYLELSERIVDDEYGYYDAFYDNITDYEEYTDVYSEDSETTIVDATTQEVSTAEAFDATLSNAINSSEIFDYTDHDTEIPDEENSTASVASSSLANDSEMEKMTDSTAGTFPTISSTWTNTETAAGSVTSATTTMHIERAPTKEIIKCLQKICPTSIPTTESTIRQVIPPVKLNITTRRQLRGLCWETMFGQELAKLTVMDLALTIISTLGMDFFRAVFVRFMNNCWCWDLEKQFPQYGDFKIAENILHLVNNQGMVWMGMFFSPGLPALNVFKLGILMYLRSWAVLTCNVPHEVVFRASRSNNFYLALLLTMLFLCVLPVGYAIVWVEPSWHCGPFSGYKRMYYLATQSLTSDLPQSFRKCLDYIASPGIVIPLIVLMALIIYYMVSLTGSLREANNDLKIQLRQERTEERRKMFQIAEKRQDVHEAPFMRWKKILPALPSNKFADIVSSKGIIGNVVLERKERKHSNNSEAGEATDVEQDSLPHDPALCHQDLANETKRKDWKSLIKHASNNRSFSSGSMKEGGDSFESHSSDYGIIPKIRISGTESGSPRSPGRISVISDTRASLPREDACNNGMPEYKLDTRPEEERL